MKLYVYILLYSRKLISVCKCDSEIGHFTDVLYPPLLLTGNILFSNIFIKIKNDISETLPGSRKTSRNSQDILFNHEKRMWVPIEFD